MPKTDRITAPAGHLTAITLYPIKSAAGVALPSATARSWGLAGDRRWAVIDEQGDLVWGVPHPLIMSVTAVPRPDGGLVLTAPGTPDLPVDVPVGVPTTGPSLLDRAVAAGPAADAWLSDVMGHRVRLVWLGEPDHRPDAPVLTDGPLLLTSASSLRLLDEWVAAAAAERGDPAPKPLDMRRFRPNLTVDTETPFAEDTWQHLRIGDVRFRFRERCDRCAITMIDPDTLARGKEPMRTLARHRLADGKVWFGVRLAAVTAGKIHVGDPVTIEP